MKIEAKQIYNGKPYYSIKYENGRIDYAFGAEQVKKFIDEAKKENEKIEIVYPNKILKDVNKLIKYL